MDPDKVRRHLTVQGRRDGERQTSGLVPCRVPYGFQTPITGKGRRSRRPRPRAEPDQIAPDVAAIVIAPSGSAISGVPRTTTLVPSGTRS